MKFIHKNRRFRDLNYGKTCKLFFVVIRFGVTASVVFVVELSESLKTTWIYKTEKITACQLFLWIHLQKNAHGRIFFQPCTVYLFQRTCFDYTHNEKKKCNWCRCSPHTFAFKLYYNNPLIAVLCIVFAASMSSLRLDQRLTPSKMPTSHSYQRIRFWLHYTHTKAEIKKRGWIAIFSLYALFIRQYSHWEKHLMQLHE